MSAWLCTLSPGEQLGVMLVVSMVANVLLGAVAGALLLVFVHAVPVDDEPSTPPAPEPPRD